jgi:AcrR family transcriptional regulator
MKSKKVTSRDLAQQKTRETLLDSAAKLVAEQGFGGVSVGDIAEAAGFTKGAFYSNFDSRDAMLLELIQRIHAEQRAAVQLLETHEPLDLEAALDLITELVVRHGNSPTAALLIGEVQIQARRAPEFATRARAGFEPQLTRFAGWIEDLCKTSGLRPVLTSWELARTVMALSQGFAQQS